MGAFDAARGTRSSSEHAAERAPHINVCVDDRRLFLHVSLARTNLFQVFSLHVYTQTEVPSVRCHHASFVSPETERTTLQF